MTIIISAMLLTTAIVTSTPHLQNIFAQLNNSTSNIADINNSTSNTSSLDQQTTKDQGADQSKLIIIKQKDPNMITIKNYDKINGTINIMNTTYEAISSKMNVSLTEAITTAEQSVGNNTKAMSAIGEEKNGFIVYSIMLGTPDMRFYKVIIDPGNGNILQSKEISKMDWIKMVYQDKGLKDMKIMKGKHSSYDNNFGLGKDKGMKGIQHGFDGYGYERDYKR